LDPLHRLEEHAAPVTALAFSPDGRWLVTGTRSGTIGIWSSEEGTSTRLFTGHRAEILALRFSPDGKHLVSASADNSAAVWSVSTGELLRRVSVPGSFIQDATFTPDGTRLVTADNSRTNAVRLWDLESGATLRVLGGHAGAVLSLAILPDGRLVTGGEDQSVRLWNLETGELSRTLEGARGGVRHLSVVSNGPLLMAGCTDQRVLVWDTQTGNAVHLWATDPLASLHWVPGTEQALTATGGLQLRVVDLKTGLTQRAFEGHTTSVTSGVAFSPDDRFVLSAGVEATTRLWNRTNGVLLRGFEGQGAGSAAAAFSPDGRQVLTTFGHPRMSARLWDAETGQLEREFRGHTDWLLAAAFSPDGTRIATGSQDRTVRIWETATGRLLQTLGSGNAFTHCVAFSHDGKRVAGGGSSFDPTVRVWDVESGELRATYQAEAGTVKSLAFSPSGNVLFVAWEEGLIRVLDLDSGQQLQELMSGGFLNELALSPDGEWLLVAEGWPSFAARLLEWRTGQVLRVFAGHTAPVESVAFSSRGRQVLTGADVVRLWDVSAVRARLKLSRKANQLELSWEMGTLQHASSLDGPWLPLPEAKSPWTPSLDLTRGFFRVAVDAVDAVEAGGASAE
jgi:WD40 repeat protein